jgi:hypothetical protein
MLPPADPKRIPWQRYWAKHDGSMSVDDSGYLVPPTRDRKFDRQPDVFAYDEVAQQPFLSLMGETGSGKTDAILEIGRSLEAAGEEVRYVDLGLVDTSEALRRELEDTKRLAKEGTHVTILFDQYEVCSLGEGTYRFVAREVADFPRDNVKIRFGCRSGSWTAETAREFLTQWPNLLALEAGPLTRGDVLMALASVSTDAPGLLRRLEDRDLAPLLNRPVTLRMIMRMIERGEDLSSMTMASVYRKGIQEVVRPAGDKPHRLEGIARLVIAQRIAAASVFCRRHTISELPDDGMAVAGTMHVADLARGSESTSDKDTVRVSETAVLEVLRDSGLLNSRGAGRHGWVHASYAEYLAAEYVRAHGMPAEQVRGLLRLRDDGSPIIPELQGVVSWLLINGSLPFGDEFILRWPTAVLRSDVQSLTVAQRERLVEALLQDAERGVLDTYSAIVQLRLGKLAHPDLASQLERWFLDRDKSSRSRSLAMQIAAACNLGGLAPAIAGVALDRGESMRVRDSAAHVVVMMSDEASHKALRPLVDPGDDQDTDDQLRGCAFEALWPKHMSSAELFGLLTDERNPHFLGSYGVFLYNLPEQLRVDDIEAALGWANGHRSRDDIGRVRRVVDEILFRSFHHLDRQGILNRVGDIIIARAEAHQPLFEDGEDGNDPANLTIAARRTLIEHLAGRLLANDLSKVTMSARPSLLEPDDVVWLISKHHDDDAGPWARLLGELVVRSTEAIGPYIAELREAADESERMAEALKWFLGPIEITSPEAQAARQRHSLMLRWAAEGAVDSEAPQRQAILEAVLAGDAAEFFRLSYALSDELHKLGLDLAALAGWQRLSSDQQEQVRAVAREYLLTRDDGRADWLGQNRYSNAALAGYQALRLLRHEAGELERLPGEVWVRWIGIAIGMPFEREKERESQQEFVRLAGRAAKDDLYDALRTLIESDGAHAQLQLLSLFPAPWDAELVRLIEDAVCDRIEKSVPLIEALIAAAPDRGEELAWSLLGEQATHEETKQQLYALLHHVGSAATRARVRRQIFATPNETGRGTVKLLAASMDFKSPDLNQRLTDSELADLYVWVEREFPASEDDNRDWFRGVGRLRSDLLINLGRRSTDETVSALRSLVETFPRHTFLQRMLWEVAERVATAGWNPPAVAGLLALTTNPMKRFIESGEDLQTAILESLWRLDVELTRSETPMVEFLWNDCPSCVPRFAPKDENALSNLVKRHLELDLVYRSVVVNREVEVRRSATGIGMRTDIYVRATRPGTPVEEARSLTVIIETKRCSNGKLMSSLKGQLVDDYLKPSGFRHGIYLVGMYDTEGHRCCPGGTTLETLRMALEAQAEAQAPDHRVKAVVLDTSLPPSMMPKESIHGYPERTSDRKH